ncbi:hypothetical protein FGO68_gene16011 [Halteria grandinella]|uniref:Uncharacterized protein n=1 Tax=Halteria grandinella TaxID=5974 RepID=A0A8J8P492_HALGN|nr:hypothetical protein FGO68_gene16011 [Halteria grandinella]
MIGRKSSFAPASVITLSRFSIIDSFWLQQPFLRMNIALRTSPRSSCVEYLLISSSDLTCFWSSDISSENNSSRGVLIYAAVGK